MLFFQVALVGGYAYSHFITNRLSPRNQWLLHVCLLLVAILTLPIRPGDEWKPDDGTFPTTKILLLLTFTVGLPFFLLSTTGPLIQRWQSQTHPDKSPFRLFALSNAASLLALVSYPFVFEQYLTLNYQSVVWTSIFVVFAFMATWSGFQFVESTKDAEPESPASPKPVIDKEANAPRPSWGAVLRWIALPMLASVQLLATTNLMTQEIGAVPFLWILPLSLYLISFIICFDHERWYSRLVCYPGLFVSAVYSCSVLSQGVQATLIDQVAAYSLVCFFAAMCCHGELAAIKPHARYLTSFYLMISIGGALGGVFVALVAPVIFINFYEFQIGLVLVCLLCCETYVGSFIRSSRQRLAFAKEQYDPMHLVVGGAGRLLEVSLFGLAGYLFIIGMETDMLTDKFFTVLAVVLLILRFKFLQKFNLWIGQLVRANEYLKGTGMVFLVGGCLYTAYYISAQFYEHWQEDRQELVLAKVRNEYGTLAVEEDYGQRSLVNGRINHGYQVMSEDFKNRPVSYYGPFSGLGLSLEYMQKIHRRTQDGMSIGVIGLGTGTVAAFGRQQDTIRFYEINPLVEEIAREYFTYLSDSPSDVSVAIGDARLVLERENADDLPKLDLLVADAFSSDSIPMHLLTLESFVIYKNRLQDDGVLAFHISNRFLNLDNVVKQLADALDWGAILVHESDDDANFISGSTWVVVSNNKSLMDHISRITDVEDWSDFAPKSIWTDDYASIIGLIDDWDDYSRGYSNGWDNGYEDGLADGRDEGYEVGFEDGVLEAESD